MLQLRARGFALRDVFADALCGLTTVEEARDIPLEKPIAASQTEKLAAIVVGPDEQTENELDAFKAALESCCNQTDLEDLAKQAQELPEEFKADARELYTAKLKTINTGGAHD